MYRPIIYTAEQVRSTDILFGFRHTMIAFSKLAAALLGTSTCVNGFACTPTSPNTLTVNVGAGEIYSMAPVDATAYGVLPADTTDQILKQGVVLGTSNLACPAPTTAGFSINYLIEAEFQENDNANVVLPFYNSANPSQPFSGQNNSGAPLPTQRQGTCLLQVKPGAAAATGTQVTPSPDAGFVGLWVVTVAYGQTGISAGNIVEASGAPFLTENLQTILSTLAGYAQLGVTQAWTKGQSGAPVPIAFASTITPNFAAANNFSIAVTGNFSLANPTNVVPGQSGIIEFNLSGSFTISSFGNLYVAANGTKPQLQAAAGGTDLFSYYTTSTGKVVLAAIPKVS